MAAPDRLADCFAKTNLFAVGDARIVKRCVGTWLTMKFCDADACPSCALVEDECACLQHKARFCIGLAARTSNSGLRVALEKLGLDLIAESDALEKERAVVCHDKRLRCS